MTFAGAGRPARGLDAARAAAAWRPASALGRLPGQLVGDLGQLGAVAVALGEFGSEIGHSTPTSGSSQAIPASVAGS